MGLIKIKLLAIISILLISLSSCTKEIGINYKNNSTTSKTNIDLNEIVSNVKSWYDSSLNIKISSILEANIKSSSVTNLSAADLNIKDIQWNNAFISFDTVGKRTISIPLSLDSVTGEYIQMVVGITDKGYTGYFIKSKPDAFYYKVQRNIYDFYNFSGSIYIYDISGKFLNYINFEQGKVQSKEIQTRDSSLFKSFSDPVDAELPTVTVVGYINNSGYLVIVPFAAGGTGGDGFAMTSSVGSGVFVGGDGSVTAPLRIANFIKDSCLSIIVEKIIDANLGDNLSKSFFSIFSKNEKMNLFFSENTNLDRPGGFQVTHPSLDVTNYNIYLNLSKMQNSSDEYKANVIVHEIAHAIIRSLYTDENVYKDLGFDGRH